MLLWMMMVVMMTTTLMLMLMTAMLSQHATPRHAPFCECRALIRI